MSPPRSVAARQGTIDKPLWHLHHVAASSRSRLGRALTSLRRAGRLEEVVRAGQQAGQAGSEADGAAAAAQPEREGHPAAPAHPVPRPVAGAGVVCALTDTLSVAILCGDRRGPTHAAAGCLWIEVARGSCQARCQQHAGLHRARTSGILHDGRLQLEDAARRPACLWWVVVVGLCARRTHTPRGRVAVSVPASAPDPASDPEPHLAAQTKDVINSQRTGQPIKDQRLAKLLEEAKPTSGPPADFSAKARLQQSDDNLRLP